MFWTQRRELEVLRSLSFKWSHCHCQFWRKLVPYGKRPVTCVPAGPKLRWQSLHLLVSIFNIIRCGLPRRFMFKIFRDPLSCFGTQFRPDVSTDVEVAPSSLTTLTSCLFCTASEGNGFNIAYEVRISPTLLVISFNPSPLFSIDRMILSWPLKTKVPLVLCTILLFQGIT